MKRILNFAFIFNLKWRNILISDAVELHQTNDWCIRLRHYVHFLDNVDPFFSALILLSELRSITVFQSMYMFLGLAIICDDYFVASLEQIVEVIHPSR